MPHRSTEDLFRSWRRTGDAGQLAAVYDRTAGRLLVVASHLCADIDAAEDAVQGTFLAALQHADRWDAGRPLEPWLLGILGNLVARERRARARGPGATATEPAAGDDPAAVAAGAEFDAAVDAAIDELPEVYRPVLVLRLKHGLSPGDIAHALRRPPGTVRSQLARGLEQLRARLPAGFAAGVAALVTPQVGLAAIRGRVLEAAQATAGTGTTLIGIGGVIMGMKAWLSVAGAGLLALLVWQVGRADAGVAPTAGDVAGVPPGRVAVEGTGQAPDAVRTPLAATGTGTGARPTATVRGRCVDEGGRPVAGCRVVFNGRFINSNRRNAYFAKYDTLAWENPGIARTDEDGRFSFEVTPPPEFFDFLVAVWPDDACRMMVDLEESFGPGTERDLGDITLVPGASVTGRVVDGAGHGVGGVRVHASRLDRPHRQRGVIHVRDSLPTVTSREDGTFALPWRLAPGQWEIEAEADEVRLEAPLVLTTRAPQRQADIVVQVVRPFAMRAIRGAVVDTDGVPVPGARVGGDGAATAITDARGQFVLRHWARDPGAATRLRASADGFESDMKGMRQTTVAWGSEGVRLVIHRTVDLKVRVVHARTRRPFTRFSVDVRPTGAPDYGKQLRTARRPEGIAVVEGLARGTYAVLVDPQDEAFARSGAVPIDTSAGGAVEVTVEIHPVVTAQLRVTAGGRPVAGTEVWLLAAGAEPGPAPEAERWDERALTRPGRLLQRGATDGHGELTLRGSPSRRYCLRILGPGHVPVALDDVGLRADAPVEVAVDVGATVRGRIGPAALVAQLYEGMGCAADAVAARRSRYSDMKTPGVYLGGEDGQGAFPPLSARCGLRRDGTFEITGCPPGRWKLLLHSMENGGLYIDVAAGLVLREGAVTRVDADLKQHLRGELLGRAFFNGEPLVGRDVFSARINAYTAATDLEGRFRLLLPRGPCSMHVRFPFPQDGRSMLLRAEESVAIRALTTVRQDFHFWSGRLRVRVLGADGRPRAGVVVNAGPIALDGLDDEGTRRLPETDEAGEAEAAAPAGRVRVWIYPKGLREMSARWQFVQEHGRDALDRCVIGPGDVEIPRLGSTDVLVIRLPADAGY